MDHKLQCQLRQWVWLQDLSLAFHSHSPQQELAHLVFHSRLLYRAPSLFRYRRHPSDVDASNSLLLHYKWNEYQRLAIYISDSRYFEASSLRSTCFYGSATSHILLHNTRHKCSGCSVHISRSSHLYPQCTSFNWGDTTNHFILTRGFL
jgi:hypothetical protein